ncbi:MAG: hypothetical protein AAF383_20650 [Cyanobacteria bacterium P01_A01_bin.83]
MTNSTALDKRQNKSFVVTNGSILKEYAQKNQALLGQGIVVINLLLLTDQSISELSLDKLELKDSQEITVHQPISYIPKTSFWFKMINVKLKKKHQIDLQKPENFTDKFLIVFIKDASIEHFSIYSIKIA